MWCALYPDFMDSVIAMAAGAAVPVQGIAWHIIGRKIIESDARFNGGDYYGDPEAVARAAGGAHGRAYDLPLARRRCRRSSGAAAAATRGSSRSTRTSSTRGRSSLGVRRELVHPRAGGDGRDGPGRAVRLARDAHSRSGADETLLVSFDTDWLFPVAEVERMETALRAQRGRRAARADLVTERPRHVPHRLRPDHAAGARVSRLKSTRKWRTGTLAGRWVGKEGTGKT